MRVLYPNGDAPMPGDKVRLTAGHPHAGETGTYTGDEHTALGVYPVVQLDDCPHGVTECFVIRRAEWKRTDGVAWRPIVAQEV